MDDPSGDFDFDHREQIPFSQFEDNQPLSIDEATLVPGDPHPVNPESSNPAPDPAFTARDDTVGTTVSPINSHSVPAQPDFQSSTLPGNTTTSALNQTSTFQGFMGPSNTVQVANGMPMTDDMRLNAIIALTRWQTGRLERLQASVNIMRMMINIDTHLPNHVQTIEEYVLYLEQTVQTLENLGFL